MDPETSNEGAGINLFAELVSEATDGKVTVETYFNSSMIAQGQEISSLSKGTLDMTVYGLSGYYDWYDMLESCYFFKNAEHKDAFYASDIAAGLFDTVAKELGCPFSREL